jgi:hypothetical protein
VDHQTTQAALMIPPGPEVLKDCRVHQHCWPLYCNPAQSLLHLWWCLCLLGEGLLVLQCWVVSYALHCQPMCWSGNLPLQPGALVAGSLQA